MGGHGGINILHEKKWHTYNTSNRIRVERDERNAREQAAEESRVERQTRLRQKVQRLRSNSSGFDDKEGEASRSSGSNINLFATEEKEWEAVLKDHNKHIRGQEINNQLAGKSKKRPLSEFDEMASLKPWYLKSRNTSRYSDEHKVQTSEAKSSEINNEQSVASLPEKSNRKRKRGHRHPTREELRAKRLQREDVERKRAENVKQSLR